MLSKNRLNELKELYYTSDNMNNFDGNNSSDVAKRPFLTRDLIEAKVQIDRWGVVTTDWIFHPSKKDMLIALFPKEEEAPEAKGFKDALMLLAKYAATMELGKKIDELTDDNVSSQVNKNVITDFYIWGAKVHFTEELLPNEAFGLALSPDMTLMPNDSDKLSNSIIIFYVP